MKRTHIPTLLIEILSLGMTLASCSKSTPKAIDPDIKMETAIVARMKQKADLVTTEVKIRKLAIYDSSKHEKVELTDPRTWKYGERKCIVPVTITIKYGYDMRQLQVDHVRLSDDSTAVAILLPDPKVIDAGYEAEVEEDEVVRMSSGLRDRIGHGEVDLLMEKIYQSIDEADIRAMVETDIQRNAQVVFASIVRSLGMKNMDVIVYRKEDWKL